MGGGIVLDDIHEFDLMFWFNNFQKAVDYKIIKNKISDLETDTEDIAAGVFQFENGVIGTVRCDYLQQKYTRTCKIKGEKGNLFWKFKANTVTLQENEKDSVIFETDFDYNNVFILQFEHFFDQIEKKQETCNNVETAKNLLQYLL